MKILLIAVFPLLLAACAGNPAAIRQAEQACRSQAGAQVDPGCVERETERIYKSWGRDSLTKGD